ncbi:MAG: hypothetical protein R6W80_16830, partial [Haliea sp.]
GASLDALSHMPSSLLAAPRPARLCNALGILRIVLCAVGSISFELRLVGINIGVRFNIYISH